MCDPTELAKQSGNDKAHKEPVEAYDAAAGKHVEAPHPEAKGDVSAPKTVSPFKLGQ